MTLALTDATTALLKEAAEWRLLGALFDRPTRTWRDVVRGLAAECDDRQLTALATSSLEATEGAYLRALGPGGLASPREIAYSATRDPGHVLAQLTAFYEAFAYRPPTDEPPDHVAVETGFVAYLRLKEAFALATGDDDHAQVTSAAASAFVESHLSTFAQPLAARLEGRCDDYLARAAAALLARTGPRRADAEGGWVPAGLDGPMECGGCGIGD